MCSNNNSIYVRFLGEISDAQMNGLSYIHCEPKIHTKCFCHVVPKTQSILIKFGTQCPE